jgi:hypothetical protein
MGYVGPGGADAAPIGNIFASPPAKPMLEATLAANGGAGVVYSYGNYAGDVMNFDRAAARAEAEHGIGVETVLVTDDVASAPPDQMGRRRGIAGDFFVFKILAAKAETMADLPSVVATTRRANDYTRTVGVGLSACTVPANGKPTFHLPDDELEVGLGVHGEPGIRRSHIEPADDLVDEILGSSWPTRTTPAATSRSWSTASAPRPTRSSTSCTAAHGGCWRRTGCGAEQLRRRVHHVARDGRRVDHADAARRGAPRPARRARPVSDVRADGSEAWLRSTMPSSCGC